MAFPYGIFPSAQILADDATLFKQGSCQFSDIQRGPVKNPVSEREKSVHRNRSPTWRLAALRTNTSLRINRR